MTSGNGDSVSDDGSGSYGMTTSQLSETPLAQTGCSEAPTRSPSTLNAAARRIVERLLGDVALGESRLSEATVHRPLRSSIWVAVFTGPEGGQVWRSTGLSDRDQALLVARQWEAEARAQRARHTARPPVWRAPRSEPGIGPALLTQWEVALFLGLSERAVRQIERRALRKLRNHHLLRQVWQRYRAGELDEAQRNLTPEEIRALFDLAASEDERRLLHKTLRLTHSQ